MNDKKFQSPLPPSPTDIYVWLAYYDTIADAQLLASYRALLSESERVQAGRFHFARDRHRYLVTRALVRTVLGRLLDVPPAELGFAVNEHGRPYLIDIQQSSSLHFNLAHTRGLIALAVSRGRELGIDVENTRERNPSLDIAERFFTPVEASELRAQPPQRQPQRFFEYWTLKESYIKARGMGLAIPLDKFHFCFPDDASIELHIDTELGDRAERWCFYQASLGADHLLALCVERTAQEPQLHFFDSVPLRSEEPMTVPLLAHSTPTTPR